MNKINKRQRWIFFENSFTLLEFVLNIEFVIFFAWCGLVYLTEIIFEKPWKFLIRFITKKSCPCLDEE